MTSYDDDYLAWLREQAAHLRAGRLDQLDAPHLMDEINGLARSAERALAAEVAQLLAALALQRYAPVSVSADEIDAELCASRAAVAYSLRESPSAARLLTDPRWIDVVWAQAVARAVTESGLNCYPAACPWRLLDVLGMAAPHQQTSYRDAGC
jgi:hypothetical protein